MTGDIAAWAQSLRVGERRARSACVLPRRITGLTLVLLTLDGPEHRYVGAALLRAFPRELRAIVVASPNPASPWRRARALWRRYRPEELWARAADRVYQRLTGCALRRERALRAILFGGEDGPAFPPDRTRRVGSHNGSGCLTLLDEMQPDVIAVYGTDIIRAPVMARARRNVVNMHTGLSPRYRGADSVFWALHNGEPDQIGATVHLLDDGVDSGPILATARPPLAADDDEYTLFAKCVRAGVPVYVRAITELLNGGAVALPQQLGQGRQYRFVDRTVRAERQVQRRLRDGLLRGAAGR